MGRRWCGVLVPADRARAPRGRGRRDHRRRRPAGLPATRDPDPDDGLAARPGRRTRRARRRPARLGRRDLPALRVRPRHARGQLRHGARRPPVHRAARAARAGPPGRPRRGDGRHPGPLRPGPAGHARPDQPERGQVAGPDARPTSARTTAGSDRSHGRSSRSTARRAPMPCTARRRTGATAGRATRSP